MKPKVLVLGASHATRIHTALIADNRANNFKIINNTKPGSTLGSPSTNKLCINYDALANLSENDYVIVQFLGNDLLKKNIWIERYPRKNIHLTKFEPKSENYLNNLRQTFKKILAITKAKVIIIDDIYRHVRCCKNHDFPGMIKFFTKQNKALKETFSEYTVLDHRKLLGFNYHKIKNVTEYKKILVDSVHLRKAFYSKIAEYLYSNIL